MHIKIINKLSWLNCLPAVLFTISQHLHTCKVKVREERRQIFDVNRLAPLCSAHSTPSKHQGHTDLRRIINAQITLTKCFPQIITSILANLKLYLASFHFKFFADTTTCDVTLTNRALLGELRQTNSTSCVSLATQNSPGMHSNISGSWNLCTHTSWSFKRMWDINKAGAGSESSKCFRSTLDIPVQLETRKAWGN